LTIYRICSAKYPTNDGEGARRNAGRWNHKGTPLLYCAATASLCALEILAHSAGLPVEMVVIEAEFPDSLPVETLLDADLPSSWNDPVAPSSTKDIGSRWAVAKSAAILSVPSAVVPRDRNYLVNPLHPDFPKIRFSAPVPFVFDPRLK
jgi:RES domain-containing protein